MPLLFMKSDRCHCNLLKLEQCHSITISVVSVTFSATVPSSPCRLRLQAATLRQRRRRERWWMRKGNDVRRAPWRGRQRRERDAHPATRSLLVGAGDLSRGPTVSRRSHRSSMREEAVPAEGGDGRTWRGRTADGGRTTLLNSGESEGGVGIGG